MTVELVGARRLSAAVDNAVAAYIGRVRHLDALDEWLALDDLAHLEGAKRRQQG